MSLRGSRPFPALALALALGACDGASPPDPALAPGLPTAPTAQPDAPAAAPASAPAPTGGPAFDVGEIKAAADYLQDPQFAAADLARGQLLSFACAACHTFGAGQKTIIGPNLHGVFGRPAAALTDYAYSPALRASQLVWTPPALEAWLADPARFVAGTTMTFTGYRSAEDRRDLIAYLLQATQ